MIVPTILTLALTTVPAISSPEAEESKGVAFQKLSWKEAVAKAKAEKKLVFVDFYTHW